MSLEMEKTRQIQKNKTHEKAIEEFKKNYASLKAELRNYRATVQRLRGVIEETGHKFTALDKKKQSEAKNKQEDKKINELNNKISEISKHIIELEQYIGLESSKDLPDKDLHDSAVKSEVKKDISTTEGEDPKIDKKKVKDTKIDIKDGKENPEVIYKHAKELLDKEDYDSARFEFEKFINLFPESKNADNARFWIADTYYREKWYEKSILEYQKVIENYSSGNKVAGALLKQGYSFAELGEIANARLILKELIKKYPDSKEAGFATKKLESLK